MNSMFLHIFYDGKRFDTASLVTISRAGRTERKLSRAQTAVYKVWMENRASVTVDRYSGGRCTYVSLALTKI